MNVLIDIDESLYDAIKQDIYINGMRSGKTLLQKLVASIANGIPIPKEYGKLYAEKDIREQIENPYQCQTVLYGLELVEPIVKVDEGRI